MATKQAEMVQLRATPRKVAGWRAAAEAEDVTLSEFMRRAADTYARQVLALTLPPQGAPRIGQS
jgi:uncharacterized protein (DUF1778 family)